MSGRPRGYWHLIYLLFLISVLLLPIALFVPKALSATAAIKYCQSTDFLKLPGGLDQIPTFNSNSPEQVLKAGILVSTFPPAGMKHPDAHLNYLFDGRFDLFSHHVACNESPEEDRTLFLGFIAGNPSNKKVKIEVLSGASYLSQPDAPFISLPEICNNDDGKIYAGPGDRVTNDVLRGVKPDFMPECISIPPGQNKLILCLPIPVRHLRPALNGRSTLLKLKSSGPVYLASLALFAPEKEKGGPVESTWLDALNNDVLCAPRDQAPTAPASTGKVKYGRVAGVARGTIWSADFGNAICAIEKCFKIPEPGKSITVPFSTVEAGTFGTEQVQSAPMIVRYPDTAYQAHGNYGVTYKLSIPFINPSKETRAVELLFQSALKADEHKNGICFLESAPARAFYRGTVCVQNGNDKQYWHLVQKQGAEGAKIAEFTMPAGSRRNLSLEFLYPPDATPPQELCIRSSSIKLESDN